MLVLMKMTMDMTMNSIICMDMTMYGVMCDNCVFQRFERLYQHDDVLNEKALDCNNKQPISQLSA